MIQENVLDYVPKGRENAIPQVKIWKMIEKAIDNPPDYSTIRRWLKKLKNEGLVESVKYDDFEDNEKAQYDERTTLYYIPLGNEKPNNANKIEQKKHPLVDIQISRFFHQTQLKTVNTSISASACVVSTSVSFDNSLPRLRPSESNPWESLGDMKDNLVPGEQGENSCIIENLNRFPIRVKLQIIPYHNDKPLDFVLPDCYSGKSLLRINPGRKFSGHFKLPITPESEPFDFKLKIIWSIMDQSDNVYEMEPEYYSWTNPEGDWIIQGWEII